MTIKMQHLNSIVAALLTVTWISTSAVAQSIDGTERLDLLFERLLDAEPDEVDRVEGEIITEWSKSGSPAMDLLLRRGEDAMEDGAFDVAVEHYTALIDHAPEFAEGYTGRATAYYAQGRYGPAIDDLRQTLVLEPRHFGAMIGVAVVLEEIGRVDDALEVWQRVSSLSPNDAEVRTMIQRLQTQLAGETL